MKYLEVSFVCQMQSCGFFYAYNGSMLRGALGGSLRRTVCMTQKKDCTQCMLAATCIFPRLFTAAAAPEKCGTAPMIPPPFCLLPSLEGQRVYEAGENFSFTLKLFSYAVDYLPLPWPAGRAWGVARSMGRGSFGSSTSCRTGVLYMMRKRNACVHARPGICRSRPFVLYSKKARSTCAC